MEYKAREREILENLADLCNEDLEDVKALIEELELVQSQGLETGQK
jgi:hypothetical protein